jgi:hypothetical protein
MKLLVLFLQYGNKQSSKSFIALQNILNNQLDEFQHHCVVIDNSLHPDEFQFLQNHELIGGNNSKLEFSGWDHAIKKYNFESYQGILFVTSAFLEMYTDYLKYFTNSVLKYAIEQKIFLGHIDRYPSTILLKNQRLNWWIRTAFFFLHPEIINKLGTLDSDFHTNQIFTDDWNFPFLNHQEIMCDQYKKYILDWLTGNGYDSTKWHSTFNLNSTTFDRFKSKTVSILNEHNLTLRVHKLNYRVCDVTSIYNQFKEFNKNDFPVIYDSN